MLQNRQCVGSTLAIENVELSVGFEGLDTKQQVQVSLFVDSLLEWNQRMNLTAATNRDAVMERHVMDSLALLPVLETSYSAHCSSDTSDARLKVVDVGSGAGLPGLILAIARPAWQLTLLESLQKRCNFVEYAVERSGLSNTTVVRARGEESGRNGKFRGAYDVAVARAVAEMRVLSELCLPLVRVGGLFLAAKDPNPQVMAPLIARTAHKVSRSWSCAVARIWRSVGGSLSSSVLQYRSYSDEGLDGRVPPSPEASSAADLLVDTPLSGEFPPAVPKVEIFGADRPVYDRNAYRVRKWEGFRVHRTPPVVPIAISKPQFTRTSLNEQERPFDNCLRASSNVAQESCPETPREGFVGGKELRIGSAYGGSNIHMPSASTTSEAVAILKHRQQQGLYIDSYMFVEILKRCSKQKDLRAARQVHDCIIQSGMDKHLYVATTLLNIYINCGRLQDARRVFDGLEKKDALTRIIMLGGYVKNDHVQDALELLRQGGVQLDEGLYLSILKACARPLALKWGKEIHAYIRHAGLESDVRLGTALVHMYANCGCITEARRVFEKLINRNIITWNVMIGAYAKSGCGVKAYQLFVQMKRAGFVPDAFTYTSILNASASAGALEWVKAVHSHALKAGLESHLRVGNALVQIYAKSGSINDAKLIFDRLKTRDLVTWNLVIGAYAESGCGVEAYRLFLQMTREGFKANAITYVSILNASASIGALYWVKEVHSHAVKSRLVSELVVANALLHMYGKSGSLDDARLFFARMAQRNVVTFNVMIGVLAQHGCGHEALELFGKMNADCVKPNGTSFVAVLSACSHAGLLDDGRILFLAMMQDYGIEPTVVHYTCMVDLLGRAGHLEEAKLFIDDMPVEPNGVTWKALLGACRTYGNVELGELAARELLKLEPKNASTYVLLSNIYAAAGKWEKVSSVRTIMRKRGIWKEAGRSWIEVDNKIHEFVVSDTSHPGAKAIYTQLNKLTEKLKAEGYIPDTQLVLRDIAEEDKELALCSHSEKLAIAYGLISIPHGKPVRVFKNLRVCPDCHTATKLISKVTGREIIARDASRFHHFKDGMCSCADFW